jgi:hypothetical protein
LKNRAAVFLLILFLAQLIPVQAAQQDQGDWTNVGPGVDYQLFLLAGPNRAHVARMDRSNPRAIIESSIAGGRLARTNETTSAMARRYDGALNYWGNPDGIREQWGSTNQVVAAINGFYVEANWVTPQSGQIHSGWYSKRFINPGGQPLSSSGFAWKLNRSAFIGVGDCVTHPPSKQAVVFSDSEQQLLFQGINTPRISDSLVLYTPQFDTRTPASPEVEVLVELTRPLLLLPLGSSSVRGIIKEIRQNGQPFIIPFDHLVLAGQGAAAAALLNYSAVGSEVRISQEINNYNSTDCPIQPSVNWDKTYASIGGQYNFLVNGEIYNTGPDGIVHPRTAVAYNDSYIFFIVVDGRAPGFSAGMTILQLAVFARDALGATWGIALDGGGSSTMVINDVVVNRPSDVCRFIYLPVIGRAPGGTPVPEVLDPELGFHQYTGACERRTGNGLMMVAVQDANYSPTFVEEIERVETRGQTNVRLGPGTNYAVIATVPGGSRGSVSVHSNLLNGVYAKNQYWWKVRFDAITGGPVEGWVIEDALVSVTNTASLWKHFR